MIMTVVVVSRSHVVVIVVINFVIGLLGVVNSKDEFA